MNTKEKEYMRTTYGADYADSHPVLCRAIEQGYVTIEDLLNSKIKPKEQPMTAPTSDSRWDFMIHS